METDPELLRRYATDGSEGAFREIVERRFGLVYAVALRQVGGDEHLARDVAQRVFSELAQQATRLADRPAITGWLYRTARCTGIDVVRTERRRRERETEAQIMQDLTNIETETEWSALRPVLDDAVSALNDNDRDLVTQRLFEERSFGQIGHALCISEDAARMRFERALVRLRRQLCGRGITSTTAGLTMVLSNQAVATVPAGFVDSVAGAALASAKVTVTVGSLAGITASMTTTKTIIAVSSVVAVLALSFGIDRANGARVDAEQIAAMRGEIERVNRRADWLARNRPVPSAPAKREQVAGARAATAPEKTAADLEVERMREKYELVQKVRASNVEHQQLDLRVTKTDTRLEYASFYRKLGLSPGQIEQFENLMAQRAASTLDIDAAIRGLGLDPADAVANELRKREDEQFQSAMRALIGDAAYVQFQEREATAPVRGLVSRVAEAVYYTDTPLAAEQAARLTEIVIRHNPHLQNPEEKWRRDGIDWDATIAEARGVLAPGQLAAWQGLIADERLSSEAIRRLNRH